MVRQLKVLGAGFDTKHAEIFLSIEQVGLAAPSSRATVTRKTALDLIRGLSAAIQQDDEARAREPRAREPRKAS